MIRIFFVLALLIASIYLGVQLQHDPGYVLIAINHWTIETSLIVAALTIIFSFIILHSLLVLLHRLTLLPTHMAEWKLRRRALKAQKITRQGLIEFSEGYWSTAKNHLIKALPNTDTPLLNYLTAARAAQEMGDSQLRDDYLREAQQAMPEAKIAVELTQAQLQLANQQWEQALATLRHLQDLAPHHPYVLKLLMHLYQEVRDWPQLIALLPELQKHQIIDKTSFENLRRYAYLQALTDLTRIANEEALEELVNKLPKSLKLDADLMTCYCGFLIKNNQEVKAESILRRCLYKGYNEKLIHLYGQIYVNDKQLAFAESLLKKTPHSTALYLCLGNLCVAKHLWGKARTYFEKSLALEASPSACKALGKLYEQLGELDKACLTYQRGLELAL